MDNKTVTGFKGFDKDLVCSPPGSRQAYEVGKTYEFAEAKLCETGGHFCLDPFDVWKHYPVLDDEANLNRFAEVEGADVSDETSGDSKRVAKRLTIKVELSLKAMIDAALKFVFERVEFEKSIEGSQAASGDAAKLAASGDDAKLAASGYAAKLESTGERGIVAGVGINNMAKGKLGCWIVLAEYESTDDGWRVADVKANKIDGKKLKADTWYRLKGGEFMESST